MATARIFKKELTRDQLLAIVLEYLRKLEKTNDKRVGAMLVEEMIGEIITAEYTRLWLIDHTEKSFSNETIDKAKRLELPWGKGLLTEGLKAKSAFYRNFVAEEKKYDPDYDNIEGHDQKDILIFPVSDEKGEVLFILESATSKKDLQQFTDNDLKTVQSVEPYLRDLYPLLLKDGGDNNPDNRELAEKIKSLDEEKNRALAKADASTQFLAEVAHEIRTPMNAVMGFIDLLRVDEKDKAKLLYLESAAKSGEMMIALINDLLDFSKIEKGMMELEAITFDPLKEFDALAPLFCARMKKKGVFFTLYLDPEMPKEVISDPNRIKQILSNLIGNAIKFTPKGGEISLEINFDRKTKTMRFDVIDTGIGIAEENQKKIFEAYSQETSATARKFGGTGLGLSISSRLAEKLGGTLQLQSKPDEGSRFFFSVSFKDAIVDADSKFDLTVLKTIRPALIFSEKFTPIEALVRRYLGTFGLQETDVRVYTSCRQVDMNVCTHLLTSPDMLDYPKAQETLDKGVPIIIFKQTAFDFYTEDLNGPVSEIDCTFGPERLYDVLVQTQEAPQEALETVRINARRTPKRVMIVDDNNLNIHFMREVVKKLGAVVESASDGEEAVEIYKRMQAWRDPFDLILMDENMPKMNGTEAAEIISRLEKEHSYTHIPIIGISGDATEEQRKRAIASGMDDCIFKPVSVKKISEIFAQFVKE